MSEGKVGTWVCSCEFTLSDGGVRSREDRGAVGIFQQPSLFIRDVFQYWGIGMVENRCFLSPRRTCTDTYESGVVEERMS